MNVVQETTIALRRIDRLQQKEVRPEFHLPHAVSWRAFEIGNPSIADMTRRNFEIETPRNRFVGTRSTKAMSVSERFPGIDLNAHHFRNRGTDVAKQSQRQQGETLE